MVSENRVVRKIFGFRRKKWQEAEEDCSNEELQNFYALPNIIRVIKSRKMR